MNQTNVKVSFYLKKSEEDAYGNCPVMAKLNIGKYSESAFSMKLKVPQKIWAAGRATGKSVAAKEINNRLDEIRARALGIYAELSAVRDGVSAEEVKHRLLGMASGQETLLGYFTKFIGNFEKRVGINRTAKTLGGYRNAYNHVERFIRSQYKVSDIPFTALDLSFIEKYDLHLRTECHLAPGTVINLTVRLKTVVGEAIADGRSANAITVNRAIDDLTSEIEGHYRRIKDGLGFITAELVKNAVKGVGQKPLTLLALFREHNEEYRKRIGVDRIKETYDSYMRSYKHLSAFVHEKKGVEDVTLRSLDRVFYDDFEVFLRMELGLAPKTVHEHLYRLKKMTMRAVSQGTLRRDPYCRLHPQLPGRKSRHMKLEDLKTLMETPVEKPQLQFVRDMFIFSTFTGIANTSS